MPPSTAFAPGGIVVKFLTKHYNGDKNPIWLRMTPGGSGQWGSCVFVPGPTLTKYDWLVVYDDWPAADGSGSEILRCPAEHTLLITNEPPPIKLYEHAFTRQFAHVLTSQDSHALPHPGRIYSPSTLLWYYGQQAPYVRDYDTLATAAPSHKTKDISTVCSSKQQRHTLHHQRYQFTQALKQRLPELAIFGHGVRPITDKIEAIDAFRYHMVIENHVAAHHWTEKLADAFLGCSLPFYYGCPDLEDYFPTDSFIRIDIHNVEQAHRIIRKAIAEGAYEKRLPAILEARRRVLERYNLFALAEKIIRKHHASSGRPSSINGLRVFNRKTSRRRHPFLAVPFLLKKGFAQLAGRIRRAPRFPISD